MTSELTLNPTDLRDFLKSQGWMSIEAALKRRIYAFDHPAFPRRQLIYPMDTTAPDYEEAVQRVIAKLAEMTGASAQSLAAKARSVRDDVLRLRIFAGANDSEVPLGFASSLINSAEKMLKAAACTVMRPRPHYPKLGFSEAIQIMEKIRFGQTERGSFVLKVACPLDALEARGSLNLDDVGAPFVRQVTLVLNRGLRLITNAIESDSIDDLVATMRKSESPLVSSNLCEALAGMHDARMANSLDLGFDWSILRNVPSQDFHDPVRLQRDYFPRIEEVRRELRSVERAQEDTFIGTVECMDGDLGADGHRSGTVVLAILMPEEGEIVRARTVLSAEQYAIANRAHMSDGTYVRVSGVLRPGRQPRQLADVRDFQIVPKS